MDSSKESRRDKHYINEEGMYILLLYNNEPKTKKTSRGTVTMRCFLMFDSNSKAR